MTARGSAPGLDGWRRALDLEEAGDKVFLRMLGLLTAEVLVAAGVLVFASIWSVSEWTTALSNSTPLWPKTALVLILPALYLALIAVNATDQATRETGDAHLRRSLTCVALGAAVLSSSAALLALALPVWLSV